MSRLVGIPFKYPRIIWSIVLAVIAVGAVGAPRVSWVQDITALLPKEKDSLISTAREWGMMKTVTAVIGPATEPGGASLHAALDEAAAEISSLKGTASVTARISSDAAVNTVRLLTARAARLYRPGSNPPPTSKQIEESLAQLKKRLAAPEAVMTGAYLLADPLGFSRDALKSLEGAGAAAGTTVEKGHLLSKDKKYGLIFIEIDFDPMEIEQSRFYTDALDKVLSSVSTSRDGIAAWAFGGVYFADATASVMIRDVGFALGMTVVLVIVVFLFFFRSIKMLPFALLPSGAGILFALGIMGFLNIQVHAVTVGFAATVCGIGIDYVIHLLYRAKSFGLASSEEAVRSALEDIIRPVSLGFFTTEGAFALVACSGFTGVRQLAVFSLIALPVAFFIAVFATPSLHNFLLKKKSSPRRSLGGSTSAAFKLPTIGERGGRIVRVGFFVLLCISIVIASRVELSGDPKDLGYTDPVLNKKEQTLRAISPGIFDQAMLVSSAGDEQGALEQNDALYDALLRAEIPADDIISVSPFLPSKKMQADSLAESSKLFSREDVRAAFEAAGFKDEYISSLKHSDAPLLTAADFSKTGLFKLIENSLHTDEKGTTYCLTRVKINGDEDLAHLLDIATDVGARLVSERLETKATLLKLQKEIAVMLSVWLLAAFIGVAAVRRSIRFGLLVALPALLGVAASVAVFALLGRPLTAVASAGITLVLGLAVDYSIFMQSVKREHAAETAEAVFASCLTTLSGFGVLAVTDIRAMADIGLIILVGISVSALAALFFVPSMQKKKIKETAK